MHAEDLLVDDGGDGQGVEAVREDLPQLHVVSPLACGGAVPRTTRVHTQHTRSRQAGHNDTLGSCHARSLPKTSSLADHKRQGARQRPRTLVVEAVDAVDGRALVVASEDEEVLWVLDLEGEQQADGLKALFAPRKVVPALNSCIAVILVSRRLALTSYVQALCLEASIYFSHTKRTFKVDKGF